MSDTPIRDCERWIANRIWIDDGLEILEQYSSDGTNWIADAGNLSVAKRIIAEHNTLRGIPTEALTTLADDLVKATDCFTQEEIDAVLAHPDLDDDSAAALGRLIALSDFLREHREGREA